MDLVDLNVVAVKLDENNTTFYVQRKDGDENHWCDIKSQEYFGKCRKEEQLSFICFSIASKYGNIDRKEIIDLIPGAKHVNGIPEFDKISCDSTDSIEEIIQCVDHFYGTVNGVRDYTKERIKNTIAYPCDGIVIKLADSDESSQKLKPRNKNGKIVLPHDPEDQVAVKFPTDPAISRIIKIHYKKTKLGNTTCSCNIEPVVLEGGAVVKCVNLHNPNWLSLPENSWIKEGVECEVRLSMDIIPIISKV